MRIEQRSGTAQPFQHSARPLTTDELAEALAQYPKGTRVYVGGGGFAFAPTSVHRGNRYSLDPEQEDFVTIEGKP